jgi:hypothetical protein
LIETKNRRLVGGVVASLVVACSSPPIAQTTNIEVTSVAESSTTPSTTVDNSPTASTPATTAAEADLDGLVFEIDGDVARAPAAVPSGLVEVTFVNRGQTSHGAFNSDTAIRHGIFLMPGELARGIVEFDAGSEYVFEALLPPFAGGEDDFSVSDEVSGTTAPDPDVSVGLAEFTFSLPAILSAGSEWWALGNTGEQNHDIGIYSLEGRTLEELISEIEFVDPWEHQTVVPTWVVGPQETVYANIELAVGNYGLICRVPDDASSRRHFQLGMVAEITVEE